MESMTSLLTNQKFSLLIKVFNEFKHVCKRERYSRKELYKPKGVMDLKKSHQK